MKAAPRYDLRALLMALVFLHGALAAAMVPVLNQRLGESAPWAFALYFGAMVAAQAAIWRIGALTRFRGALSLYEVLFAAALVYMALTMTYWGFLSGRVLEGIGSGLTLPLIFAGVLRLEAWGEPEKRIAWMNSSFALGFVAGPFLARPFLSDGGSTGTSSFLGVFAAAFVVVAVGLRLRPPSAPSGAEASEKPAGGLARFWPLFCAKLVYGFMFAFLGGHAHLLFPELAVEYVMLALAAVFIVGQVLTTGIIRGWGLRPGLRVGPLLLAGACIGLALTGRGELLFGIGLAHSILVLLGYRMLAGSPEDARTFALFNLSTDPALVIGALLARLGTQGAWGLALVGTLALVLSFTAPFPEPDEPGEA